MVCFLFGSHSLCLAVESVQSSDTVTIYSLPVKQNHLCVKQSWCWADAVCDPS